MTDTEKATKQLITLTEALIGELLGPEAVDGDEAQRLSDVLSYLSRAAMAANRVITQTDGYDSRAHDYWMLGIEARFDDARKRMERK